MQARSILQQAAYSLYLAANTWLRTEEFVREKWQRQALVKAKIAVQARGTLRLIMENIINR